MTDTKRPIHSIRYEGVELSIWPSNRETGPRYAIAIRRVYRHLGQWKTSSYFSEHHLGVTGELMRQARQWIKEHRHGGTPAQAA